MTSMIEHWQQQLQRLPLWVTQHFDGSTVEIVWSNEHGEAIVSVRGCENPYYDGLYHVGCTMKLGGRPLDILTPSRVKRSVSKSKTFDVLDCEGCNLQGYLPKMAKCAGCGLIEVEFEGQRCEDCQKALNDAEPKEHLKFPTCPNCKRDAPPGSILCSHCGTNLGPNSNQVLYQMRG